MLDHNHAEFTWIKYELTRSVVNGMGENIVVYRQSFLTRIYQFSTISVSRKNHRCHWCLSQKEMCRLITWGKVSMFSNWNILVCVFIYNFVHFVKFTEMFNQSLTKRLSYHVVFGKSTRRPSIIVILARTNIKLFIGNVTCLLQFNNLIFKTQFTLKFINKIHYIFNQ